MIHEHLSNQYTQQHSFALSQGFAPLLYTGKQVNGSEVIAEGEVGAWS